MLIGHIEGANCLMKGNGTDVVDLPVFRSDEGFVSAWNTHAWGTCCVEPGRTGLSLYRRIDPSTGHGRSKAGMSKRITQRKFAEQFERETGFDMMDRDGRTAQEHMAHNIQWFRDWAQETAERLEELAKRVRR
jgi:hypothetical protein